ncbi:hypothetical protein GCM10011610_22090 [Nocardia rhizosphaerihabitans]|uniref:Beta-ketoacyl-[acyl-carrier-protein] synthase III N-terminal domain-containing protein n=1 Tax=Nocardia rhizosphaerihabitans TaxID=1691570 RepID=A0ABQ2K9V1_9NOCA|nr:hypothetical protein GCM10011610_22090 [Nocardia rhizosphaerihabitans]
MGIIISSAVTQTGGVSSVGQAAEAARAALTGAGCTPEQIDALINVGVYRDANLVEPAVAALIQQAAGIGLEYRPGDVPCLSFDLMNGACGVVNAVGVAASLLADLPAGHVVIVSGDAHPSMRADADFPFEPVGAALVLENSTDAVGFGGVHVSAGDALPDPQGYVNLSTMGSTGRSALTVELGTDTAELVEHAVAAAREALAADDIDAAQVVLVCGKPTPGFAAALAAELGVGAVVTDDFAGDAHTSALTAAYVAARDAGLTQRPLLFVAADGGPTAAAVTYRGPGVR